MNIKKVVIPAAGLGTRFLPITKSIPKEMIPILNKPAIQYIIEEAHSSKIDDFFIITNESKPAISHYLSSSLSSFNYKYINQENRWGLGHAVLTARDYLFEDDFFSVMLPDDIIVSRDPAINQLISIAMREKVSVIAVCQVPLETVSSYGVIAVKKQILPNLFEVSDLVEKPDVISAPSNLAIIGRYVLSSKIFESLEYIKDKVEGESQKKEIQLTDAIAHMLHNGQKVLALKVEGIRHDVGTPAGWLKAVIEISLKDPEYGQHIRRIFEENNFRI